MNNPTKSPQSRQKLYMPTNTATAAPPTNPNTACDPAFKHAAAPVGVAAAVAADVALALVDTPLVCVAATDEEEPVAVDELGLSPVVCPPSQLELRLVKLANWFVYAA